MKIHSGWFNLIIIFFFQRSVNFERTFWCLQFFQKMSLKTLIFGSFLEELKTLKSVCINCYIAPKHEHPNIPTSQHSNNSIHQLSQIRNTSRPHRDLNPGLIAPQFTALSTRPLAAFFFKEWKKVILNHKLIGAIIILLSLSKNRVMFYFVPELHCYFM